MGLRVIAGVCIGAPLSVYLMGALWLPGLPDASMISTDVAQVAVGLVALGLSFRSWARRYARSLGLAVGLTIATIQAVTTTNWGLFVSRSIIVEHGGSLHLVSELGKGTTARVHLPGAA